MVIFSFNEASSRTNKAKKNIYISGLFKIGDTLIYLLLVPLTLGYLNAYEYGIWLTLNSILGWINSFDIGLGNGLRNKLAEALAKDEKILARQYVSTAFFMLISILIVIIVFGLIIAQVINWEKLLNITTPVLHLDEIIVLSYIFFCINFVLKFVGNVYQALQIPSAMYIINFAGHLLSLLIIYALTLTTEGNLLFVALVYSATPPFIYAICYPITFKKMFKFLDPSLLYFDKGCIKELFNLSILFFIMQLSGLFLYSLSNLIISNMFGPAEVTPFNIAQRYFGIIPMISNIVLAPIWSATTDAYIKNDMKWIKKAHAMMVRYLLLSFVSLGVMVVLSPIVYLLWIGNKVEIPFIISILSALYNFIFLWSLSYSYLLNGMGKLKIQMMTTIVFSLCFYPLSRFLGELYLIPGIIIAMCIAIVTGAILNTIQVNKIIRGTASGIWLR